MFGKGKIWNSSVWKKPKFTILIFGQGRNLEFQCLEKASLERLNLELRCLEKSKIYNF